MDTKTFGQMLHMEDSQSGTLSTSTRVYFYVPCKARLLSFAVCLENTGGTSGATTVVLKNGSTVLHSGITIPYDASQPYASSETFAATDIDAGSWITAEVTDIPGTASSGLHVQLALVGLA